MPDIEKIRDYYFNYLSNVIFNAVSDANEYNCIDFNLVKVDMLINLKKILETRKQFNKNIKILSLHDKENK